MPNQFVFLLWWKHWITEDNESIGCHQTFSNAFSVNSCSILIARLVGYRLLGWIIKWVEIWLDCWAQRSVNSSTKPSWEPVSGILMDWYWGSILFNVFKFEWWRECTWESLWKIPSWRKQWSTGHYFRGTKAGCRNVFVETLQSSTK